MVEVPFENERGEEEVVGMNLQTRRRSQSQSHDIKKIHSPTSSSSSSSSSSSEISDISFEHSANMDVNFITNGENPKIIDEDRSVVGGVVLVAVDEEPYNYKGENGINVGEYENGSISSTKDEGTNDFSVHQNGDAVAESLAANDAGNKEMDVGPNGTSFSKSPETSIGLKFVESLLDESFNSINDTPPVIIHTEEQNIVDEILKSGENELALEAAEFDVEGVLQKQETHDLYCPNCNSCITKRVILSRRKRKIQEISTAPPEASDEDVDNIVEQNPENGTQEVGEVRDVAGDAVTCLSCLSCFRIFIPTGNGFLFPKFGPKPDIILHQDGTSTEPPQDITHPAEETSLPREVERPARVAPAIAPKDDDTGRLFPLWILTCCQPYERKPEKPDETAPKHEREHPPTETDVPDREITPPLPPSYIAKVSPMPEPDITPDAGTPAPPKPELPLTPDAGTPASPNPEPPLTTDAGIPVQLKPEPPITPDAGTPVPLKPEPPITPDTGTPVPLKPEPPITPDAGNQVTVPMPKEAPKPSNLSVIRPDDTPHSTRPLTDLEAHLLESPRERPSRGVSGLDIIKAIVYGGLLESITSLSVIASAAGGDATTLNIVALGLANIFGGLLVLLHNLRVLKHEHTTQHYEEQLGRPGHFLLHATVAVISYLVFGLMPPVVYGFSFRKSDDKYLKIATMAAASLVCIMILSIGKTYVRRPPKKYIQTVFYYISIGFMVSGLGYVAGELINDLLKKLGVFDSRSTLVMPVLEAVAMKEALSSY